MTLCREGETVNSFLRKVLEQREREMEEAILMTPAELLVGPRCLDCSKRLNEGDDGRAHIYCSRCARRHETVAMRRRAYRERQKRRQS